MQYELYVFHYAYIPANRRITNCVISQVCDTIANTPIAIGIACSPIVNSVYIRSEYIQYFIRLFVVYQTTISTVTIRIMR